MVLEMLTRQMNFLQTGCGWLRRPVFAEMLKNHLYQLEEAFRLSNAWRALSVPLSEISFPSALI